MPPRLVSCEFIPELHTNASGAVHAKLQLLIFELQSWCCRDRYMNAKLAAWRLSLLNLHVQLHVGLHAQTTQLAFNPHVAIELNLRDVRVELRTSRRSCITSQNDYH